MFGKESGSMSTVIRPELSKSSKYWIDRHRYYELKHFVTGVTSGVSYDFLKSRLDIPCCKETYYDLYRRFFWLLDRERK